MDGGLIRDMKVWILTHARHDESLRPCYGRKRPYMGKEMDAVPGYADGYTCGCGLDELRERIRKEPD